MFWTLIISAYISYLCWTWGVISWNLLKKMTGSQYTALPHFSILSFLGFCVLTSLLGFLSIFIPLGGIIPQLLLGIPVVLAWVYKGKQFKLLFIQDFKDMATPAILLLASCLLMILVVGSWKIVHPDTLGYHAQTIQWIEKYKAVPGLVHLQVRYGYQGLWYVSAAFFSFRFTGLHAVTFINTAILAWYLFFVTGRISRALLEKEKSFLLIGWILLLGISLISYTQVRLTAASASPDFIAVLLTWLSFYLFFLADKYNNSLSLVLVSIFSITAVVIKLSVLPVLLLLPVILYVRLRRKDFRMGIILLLMAVMMFIPFLSRNIISSGYPVFPSPIPDLFNTDWKYDPGLTSLEKDYISAYGRMPVDHSREAIDRVLHKQTGEWIPVWWNNRSLADRSIIILLIFAVAVMLLKSRIFFKISKRKAVVLFTAIAGIIFWWLQAPDPRFGFAFIIPVPAIVFYEVFQHKKIKGKSIALLLVIGPLALVLSYTAYRLVNFFSPRQLLEPVGIVEGKFKEIDCYQVKFTVPAPENSCGDAPVPCVYGDCSQFILRGSSLDEGFRAK
ncbi:MAG: hypothetical protein GC171_14040 [Terrimonas sp.]|nr:hypothetical protein [Terrimonas sp.]